jgi:hypothetical protein
VKYVTAHITRLWQSGQDIWSVSTHFLQDMYETIAYRASRVCLSACLNSITARLIYVKLGMDIAVGYPELVTFILRQIITPT